MEALLPVLERALGELCDRAGFCVSRGVCGAQDLRLAVPVPVTLVSRVLTAKIVPMDLLTQRAVMLVVWPLQDIFLVRSVGRQQQLNVLSLTMPLPVPRTRVLRPPIVYSPRVVVPHVL